MENLTLEEKATNHETWKHIHRVQTLLNRCAVLLLDRGNKHDQSKLYPPEVGPFTEFTPKLAASTYGSKEYDEIKIKMKPALDHHYAKNSHHPEFYKNGINDMSLLDMLEMLIDWKAAGERHNNGNIRKSIELNGNRFAISPQLIKILENTVVELFRGE